MPEPTPQQKQAMAIRAELCREISDAMSAVYDRIGDHCGQCHAVHEIINRPENGGPHPVANCVSCKTALNGKRFCPKCEWDHTPYNTEEP